MNERCSSARRRRAALTKLLLFAAAVFAVAPARAGGPGPDAAFRRLQSLAGAWTRTTPQGTVVELTYEPVSAGSALLEHFSTSAGRKTLTVYHRDGPELLLTHYCAQGNQPRLRYADAADSSLLRFEFRDATNLLHDSDAHLVRAELLLADSTHLRYVEVYRADGRDAADTLYYTRKP